MMISLRLERTDDFAVPISIEEDSVENVSSPELEYALVDLGTKQPDEISRRFLIFSPDS